jgi:hypothetical protein
VFAEIVVDEDALVGESFVKPFKELEAEFKSSELVTTDAKHIIATMREIAEITAYMPPVTQLSDYVPNSSDRIMIVAPISAKKRLIIQFYGFVVAAVTKLSGVAKFADFIYKLSKLQDLYEKFFPST